MTHSNANIFSNLPQIKISIIKFHQLVISYVISLSVFSCIAENGKTENEARMFEDLLPGCRQICINTRTGWTDTLFYARASGWWRAF